MAAGELAPAGLTMQERAFYSYLQQLPKGRIEQEFLPQEIVTRAFFSQ